VRLIVLTQPFFFEGEVAAITALFRAGLELLHLRKPASSVEECRALLEQLPPFCRERIVLHDHHGLCSEFRLRGLHLNGRNPAFPPGFSGQRSASCHSLAELAERKRTGEFDYLFLSPVFDSLSKQGYHSAFSAEVLAAARDEGLIDAQVMALGGIRPELLPQTAAWGFGGAVVLGYVWQDNPSERLRLLQQAAARAGECSLR
jgi:thiamine-phosphate pyrophosphorylase